MVRSERIRTSFRLPRPREVTLRGGTTLTIILLRRRRRVDAPALAEARALLALGASGDDEGEVCHLSTTHSAIAATSSQKMN